MNDQIQTWVQLVDGLSPQAAAELALVLEAGGIEHRRVASPAGWMLAVPANLAAEAAEQLADYRRENLKRPSAAPPPEMIGHGWAGVVVYAAVLMLIATCLRQFAFGFDWLAAGRMDAGALLAGQWWRAVTALTLHVDIDHLAANLAFGCFFAYFVARYFGAGLGWFAILSSGALGNLLNAFVQAPDHRSIGASTAVFGALALLTANAWLHGRGSAAGRRRRLGPLVAGIALLAYTGTGGENTDIVAHLTGFVAGFVLALVIARLRLASPGPALQRAAGAAAALLLAAAWTAALSLAG